MASANCSFCSFKTACDENDANVAATLFCAVGDKRFLEPSGAGGGDTKLLLKSSACRFGGPRRLFALVHVHGTPTVEQALHGGPDSSHYAE
jgi:hypothetical protein